MEGTRELMASQAEVSFWHGKGVSKMRDSRSTAPWIYVLNALNFTSIKTG